MVHTIERAGERADGDNLSRVQSKMLYKEKERQRLVGEHMRFKPDAVQQDLFALDAGAIEELAHQVPTVDLENKHELYKIPEGTVVHVQSEAEKKSGGRIENQIGVVYEDPTGAYGAPEKRVRMLYEVKEGDKGERVPERRWNKWERDPKTGAMRCVEIKALTSKKEARGGAVKDVEAHWKLLSGKNMIGEQCRHFNGTRTLIEFTLDTNGDVTNEHTIREDGKHKTEDIRGFAPHLAGHPTDYLQIVDGEETKKGVVPVTGHYTYGRPVIRGRHQDLKEGTNPRGTTFEHGSYYIDENK